MLIKIYSGILDALGCCSREETLRGYPFYLINAKSFLLAGLYLLLNDC